MLRRLALLALLGAPIRPNPQAQFANNSTGAPPAVRMVRVLVGAKAESRNGAFLITDQRTTFYVPEDREVIVFFEWQGPKGKHHCEANVHGPQGAFTVMSSFDYDSMQPRFGGHWKMPLSDSTPEGDWVFASKVDGQEAGEVTFHVVAGTPPSGSPKAAPLPSTGELYKLGTSSSVVVEKLDGDGKVNRSASGFLEGPRQVFTTFMAVDGAKSLRLRLPDGGEIVADGLLAWNRRQDWAVIASEGRDAGAQIGRGAKLEHRGSLLLVRHQERGQPNILSRANRWDAGGRIDWRPAFTFRTGIAARLRADHCWTLTDE